MPSTNPAVTGMPMSAASAHPTITATGIKGFLQWMKSDPTMRKVYAATSGQIWQAIADAPYGASAFAGMGKRRLGALGCCACYTSYFQCNNVCYPGGLQDSVTSCAPTCSTQSAALSSSLSSILGNGISTVLGGATAIAAGAITQAQLNQAMAGQPPLGLRVGAAPSTAISGSTLLLLGGAALLLIMGSKS